jgi:hypothetical protein
LNLFLEAFNLGLKSEKFEFQQAKHDHAWRGAKIKVFALAQTSLDPVLNILTGKYFYR